MRLDLEALWVACLLCRGSSSLCVCCMRMILHPPKCLYPTADSVCSCLYCPRIPCCYSLDSTSSLPFNTLPGKKENLIKPTRLFDWWGICSKDFSILLNYCSVTSNKGLELDQIEIKPKLELWFKIGFGLPTVALQHFCLLKDYFLILTVVKSMVLI